MGGGIDLLLAPVLAVSVIGAATVFWYRRRQLQQADITFRKVASDVRNIESALESLVPTGNYIPERVRRPAVAQASEIRDRILPRIAKVMRRVRDRATRDQYEGILRSGLLTTPTGRFGFTSWAPVHLESGAMYWFKDVIKDRPFRDLQRVKSSTRTGASLCTSRQKQAGGGMGRANRVPANPPITSTSIRRTMTMIRRL